MAEFFCCMGVVLRPRFKCEKAMVWVMSLVAALAVVDDASARSAVCRSLDAQLSSARPAPARNSDKYSKSARAQIQQLQIARAQSRQAGCGGLTSLFGSKNSAACAKLTNTIRRMDTNLAMLQRKAGKNTGTFRPNRPRILAALAANECNNASVEKRVATRRFLGASAPELSFFTTIFGGTKNTKQVVSFSVISEAKPSSTKQVSVINGGRLVVNQVDVGGGTFRTMCVRTCDGYYFPVSFSTNSSRFLKDEKACAAMCPGADTKLYYHSVPDQEPEEMISLAKTPYADTASAFSYRRDGVARNGACSCQMPPVDSQEAAFANSLNTKVKWVPYPEAKPSLLEDEETRLNSVGFLDANAIHHLLALKLGNETLASQANIRVVGPTFLPSQSRATNLPIPGRLSVQ